MWTAAAGCCKRSSPLLRGMPPRAAACGSWSWTTRVARAFFSVALGRDCGRLSAPQPVVDVCPLRPPHVLRFLSPAATYHPLLGAYLSAARSDRRSTANTTGPTNTPSLTDTIVSECFTRCQV
ncbi:unnamed protein product [Ectocarpus sp. 8 AP-2014]